MTRAHRILVTNDDGIDGPGLHALVDALAPLGEVRVIAPDRNRSAVSRSITLGQVLSVVEEPVAGAVSACATDGTPTDCVRLASLGLVGERPDIVVSGANNGLNLGDDVTYSGTVAAAFEASLVGIQGIAVSQQTVHGELGYPRESKYDYTTMKHFMRGFVQHMLEHPLPSTDTVLNVNVPGIPTETIEGVEVTTLGKRIYQDKWELQGEVDGRRHYSIYGDDPTHHDEEGTDIAAIGRKCISVTPIHFNLTKRTMMDELNTWDLEGFLR
jgi:5'-nucleotidase